MQTRLLRRTASATAILLCAACAAGEGYDPELDGIGAAGGMASGAQGGSAGVTHAGSSGTASGARGGNVSGGTSGQGGSSNVGGTGASSGQGGTTATGGATATGGTGGTMPTGGTGGTTQSGGTGGASGSGAGTGGGSGRGTGGSMSFGGAGTGGTAAGGRGQGGRSATGGASTGGTGGMSGGTGGGGGSTPGLGTWTNGYVATMYGDISSGDCSAYGGSFTDHTPINTYTCVQGSGPRKVSLASYSPGTVNNASYYAALGDLSSLWSANGSASPCTCSGSTTTTCGGPQCASEISSTGACGLCVAVKCDPDSTFKDGGFSHNSSCSTSSYVVVQNIDACPHNHTTNVGSTAGWCTDRQAQHIDLSCSGLGDISTLGTNVGQAGWLPVSVQVVDCSVGLGKHAL